MTQTDIKKSITRLQSKWNTISIATIRWHAS